MKPDQAKLTAGAIMTRGVARVGVRSSIADAISLMLENQVSGLPVVDENAQLVGIVTEGDFLRRVEVGTQRRRPRWLEFLMGPGRLAEEYVAANARRVDEVMTREVATVAEDTPLDEVVRLMERHQVKRLPVVDKERRIVGVVSRANLMRAVLATYRPPDVVATDEEIRAKVLGAINDVKWLPSAAVSVDVVEGTVTISGLIADHREAEALRVLAENIPGVEAVRLELVLGGPVLSTAVFQGH
jgi:CBS domain-containing protein